MAEGLPRAPAEANCPAKSVLAQGTLPAAEVAPLGRQPLGRSSAAEAAAEGKKRGRPKANWPEGQYRQPRGRSSAAIRLAAAVSVVESKTGGGSVRSCFSSSSSSPNKKSTNKRNKIVAAVAASKGKAKKTERRRKASCAGLNATSKRKKRAKRALPSDGPIRCVKHLLDLERLSPGIGALECRAAVGSASFSKGTLYYRWRVDLHPDGSLQYGSFRTMSPTSMSEFLKKTVPLSEAVRRDDGWHSLFVQMTDTSGMPTEEYYSLDELRADSEQIRGAVLSHAARGAGVEMTLRRMAKLVRDDLLRAQ